MMFESGVSPFELLGAGSIGLHDEKDPPSIWIHTL